jgi:hypothetical protein
MVMAGVEVVMMGWVADNPSFRSTSLDEGQGRLRLLCGTMSAVTVPSPITIALTDDYLTYSPRQEPSLGRWVEGRLWLR